MGLSEVKTLPRFPDNQLTDVSEVVGLMDCPPTKKKMPGTRLGGCNNPGATG
jgi:hypothetical protein